MNDEQFNALYLIINRKTFLLDFIIYLIPFPVFIMICGYHNIPVALMNFLFLVIVLYLYISRIIKYFKYAKDFLKKKLLLAEVILFTFIYLACFILGFFTSKKDIGNGNFEITFLFTPLDGIVFFFMLIANIVVWFLIYKNDERIKVVIKDEIVKRNKKTFDTGSEGKDKEDLRN